MRGALPHERATAAKIGRRGAIDVAATATMAKRKSDIDTASRAKAARAPGPDPDPAQLRLVQSDGARPVQGLRPRRWSMDAIFYLVGYAAITAAVLSFFGVW